MKKCKHPTCGETCRRVKPTKRRKPIRKISKKRRNSLGEKKLISEKDRLFYAEIWEERPHFCFETSAYLGEELKTLFFHHVLEKGLDRYKKYRYCKWNIVLISWRVHDQVGMDIDKCPKIKLYRNYIIKKYINHENI